MTTSRMPILLASKSLLIFSSSATAIGEREIARCARLCPASIRLAIDTSCSRFNSGTVAISRRYSLTGSDPLSSSPADRSSSESSATSATASPASTDASSSKRSSASPAGDSSCCSTSFMSSGKMDSSKLSPNFANPCACDPITSIPPCSCSILIKLVPPFPWQGDDFA